MFDLFIECILLFSARDNYFPYVYFMENIRLIFCIPRSTLTETYFDTICGFANEILITDRLIDLLKYKETKIEIKSCAILHI